MPSVWTMDRLAWHSTGNGYRRPPCNTAMAKLQLAQRLSSLPSEECLIALYPTNAGWALVSPYQAVRIPFDKMRRYRVPNPPRGCCWGASKVRPSGLRTKNKTTTDFSTPSPASIHAQPPRPETPGGCVRAEGCVRTANHLKSNQLQSTKGERDS